MEILHEDAVLEWDEKGRIFEIIDGDPLNTSIWNLTLTSLWDVLYETLQDLSILSYNKLQIVKYNKIGGHAEIYIKANQLDDEKLNFEQAVISEIILNKFSRVKEVHFNRIPGYWKVDIMETLAC